MRVGIIQSSYIPWRGYFDFIDDVDLFVYLDDTQYTKRDWRNRNRIKTAHGLKWLSVPVLFSRGDCPSNIENVKIDYSQKWINTHIKSLIHAYSKAPFYELYAKVFFDLLSKKYDTISALNVSINQWIMEQFDINTDIKMSSQYGVSASKTDRLIEILVKAGATSYLSGPAAKDYLEVNKFKEAGIALEYKVYEYQEYPQLHGDFISNVSILDLLFNCGEEARKYLKSLKPNEKVL